MELSERLAGGKVMGGWKVSEREREIWWVCTGVRASQLGGLKPMPESFPACLPVLSSWDWRVTGRAFGGFSTTIKLYCLKSW